MQGHESESPRASFDRAMTFLRGGDPAMAENICRQALNAFPRDANLLCLLGAALIKQDKPRDAEHTLTRAAQMFSDFSRAHEGLAEALIMQGKLPEALESLQRAEKLEPGSASITMKQAKVLTALGRDDKATARFEESFKLTPHREALVRGLRLQRMGNLREAEKIYREVLVREPGNVDALRLLAGIAMHARHWGDAEVLLQRALELAPDYYQGWVDLGRALQEQDRVEESLDALKRAIRLDASNSRAYAQAGNVCAFAGLHEEALDYYQQAVGKNPGDATALAGIGHVNKTIGHSDKAIESYRECIRRNPNQGEAYWSLANMKTFRFRDDEIADMQERVARPELNNESRASFQFALGKACEDAGEYARAFDYYQQGNANRREREIFDLVQTIDTHDEFIDVFSEEFLTSHGNVGCDSDAPIFIVGLPRSGSTLIEQILASHSQVEGTHELPELSRVAKSSGLQRADRAAYPRSLLVAENDEFRELGEEYLRRTARHRETDAPRFTDKMPNNFVHVGFVSLVLPNARIIDARRHPIDSCLGSYKQLFAQGQPFTYDLFEVGEFYLEYIRLMEYWDTVLPGKVLRVQYEEVVGDFENQVRRILDYCGLPFEESCLNFHETDRAVKTASSEQVRRPIYSSSVQLWRNYETNLDPLIEVLQPVLKDLPEDWQPKSLLTG